MDLVLNASLSGLAAAQKAMDSTAHNLANVSTPGFQAQHSMFENLHTAEVANNQKIPFGVSSATGWKNQHTGSLRYTGEQLDLAVDGKGYFTVDTPAGIAYTRVGRFHLDESGTLKTVQGFTVLGNKGPVTVESGNIRIEADGSVLSDGVKVNQLDIAESEGDMNPAGQGLLRPASDTRMKITESGSVLHGMLEQSSVNMFREMTDMMILMRYAQANQKAARSGDDASEQILRAARL